mmetsp:Transcript_1541/g.2206  ORF Transcript_1541/g.2206 Transcript_1541/m.2206 type:complete len:200 (+) Transcript_1541:551-1150(+)
MHYNDSRSRDATKGGVEGRRSGRRMKRGEKTGGKRHKKSHRVDDWGGRKTHGLVAMLSTFYNFAKNTHCQHSRTQPKQDFFSHFLTNFPGMEIRRTYRDHNMDPKNVGFGTTTFFFLSSLLPADLSPFTRSFPSLTVSFCSPTVAASTSRSTPFSLLLPAAAAASTSVSKVSATEMGFPGVSRTRSSSAAATFFIESNK